MIRDNSYLKNNKFAAGHKPNKTSFKKGRIPWNKDIKGLHFSPESEFKPGFTPKNKVSVGTITCRKCKKGKYRNFIKIREPNVWVELAKFIWIKNYGCIHKGMIVHHIDENALNDVIGNLQLVTRKEHFKIHKIGEKGRAAIKMARKRIDSPVNNDFGCEEEELDQLKLQL